MRTVVCDTGPVLHLAEVGRLDMLSLVGTVVVPSAVAMELDSHIAGWSLHRPDWIRIDALDPDADNQALAWVASGILHPGEAESLALARQVGCDWYLTDDAAARIFASSIGLEVHGTVGVVLWAAGNGTLTKPQAETTLDQMAGESSLWISQRVLAEAKSALGKLCTK
jgi:predicted nucleic acid-binding protein